MTAKEELLKFIFDNEFITKPRLKNDFELLVNKVIDEAQQQVKNLNIPAVVGRSEQLNFLINEAVEKEKSNIRQFLLDEGYELLSEKI